MPSELENIQLTRHGGVLHIEIDRVAKKNALTRAMYAGMADALIDAALDDDIRVVVLSGREGVFTAGNDLMDFMMDPPTGPESPVFRFLTAAVTFPKPLIAAVEGAAIGIGTTILLHCDLVYAAPSAMLKMPFTDLGLVPEAGSSLLLPRIAGNVRAAELLLFGEAFSAEQALSYGLVNEIVSGESVVGRALERAQTLAAKPAEAIRISKELLRGDQAEVLARIEKEANLFVERLASEEAQAAFMAFLNR